jgi:hypothetical protein
MQSIKEITRLLPLESFSSSSSSSFQMAELVEFKVLMRVPGPAVQGRTSSVFVSHHQPAPARS